MNIQKTSLIHPSSISSLHKARDTAVATPKTVAVKPLDTSTQSDSKAFSQSEINSAISQLDKKQATQQQLPKPFALHNRAQQALNAYNAQINLPQEESRAGIQQILGVDYYA